MKHKEIKNFLESMGFVYMDTTVDGQAIWRKDNTDFIFEIVEHTDGL